MRGLFMILTAVFIFMGTALAQTVDPDGNQPAPERVVVERGTTLQGPFVQNGLDETQTDFDPGIAPEGDYLGRVVFTRDGGRILLTNRNTNNISVFDAVTKELITNIETGSEPCYLDVSDNYAVAACSFGDEVDIINLDDYSIAAVFETEEQPWVVRVNPEGTTAYVACDINDALEVIDLATLTHTSTQYGFPISLLTYSWNSENGRSAVRFTDFSVLPGSNLLIVSDRDNNVLFYNPLTGEIEQRIEGIENCLALGVSGDGTTAVALNSSGQVNAYQIDLGTFSITATVSIPGYTLYTYEVAVNEDGSKAYMGVSNNSSALVDFTDDDYTIFTDTQTAFWVGVSADHAYAVSGQYRFTVVDFEDASIAGSYWGYSQYYGAVSPTENMAASFDPGRHEGLYLYDFTNPADIAFDSTMISGEPPEADAPRRAAISPDGTRAIISNVLSDNITILDLGTMEVLATIYIGDRVQDAAFTSDSQWAVVCGFNADAVMIIDMDTNEIAAEVPTGLRPAVVSIAPDDSRAYVGNISSNTVSVIELDGPESQEIEQIPVGVIGVIWACYGVSSDVRVSPDGDAVLVASSFNDQVYIIDTESLNVEATLNTGDFPIQIAFDDTGDYAIVSNYMDDTATLIRVDGADSDVIGTFPAGDGPLRVAYNPYREEFAVANYIGRTVTCFDRTTGAVTHTDNYSAYGYLYQLEYDAFGQPVVLTGPTIDDPGRLIYFEGESILPAGPSFFAIAPDAGEAGMALVAMPGPDRVTLVEWEQVNHPPFPFELLEPAHLDSISVAQETATFVWEPAVDPDVGDEVSYSIFFQPVQDTDTLLVETGITETSTSFDPYDLLAVLDHPFDGVQPFWWWVTATSNGDTVASESQWGFLIVDENMNEPPAPFSLLEPENGSQISIENEEVSFRWEQSHDPDPGDAIRYDLTFSPEADTARLVFSALDNTQMTLNPFDLVDAFGIDMIGENIVWTVEAISRTDTTACNQSWTFVLYDPAAVGEDAPSADLPERYEISAVYPNPFNPAVTLRFGLPEPGRIRMVVYDVLGRVADVPLSGWFAAGWHQVSWKAARGLAGGTYIVCLETPGGILTRKVALVR